MWAAGVAGNQDAWDSRPAHAVTSRAPGNVSAGTGLLGSVQVWAELSPGHRSPLPSTACWGGGCSCRPSKPSCRVWAGPSSPAPSAVARNSHPPCPRCWWQRPVQPRSPRAWTKDPGGAGAPLCQTPCGGTAQDGDRGLAPLYFSVWL